MTHTARTLTKSEFLAGSQCHKLLWWRRHEPHAIELQPDQVLQDLFDQGRAVGERARERFPNGILIPSHLPREARVQVTQDALSGVSSAVFEAAFETPELFVATDVIARTDDGWHFVEVKSSSSVKPEHILDVAVQVHAMSHTAGIPNCVSVMHLNKEFRHPDRGNLFATTDVTEDVMRAVESVAESARQQLAVLHGPLPDVPIGAHCSEPRACVFRDRCWPSDPRHISRLYNVGPKRTAEYMGQGIHSIDDIPKGAKLPFAAQRQIRSLNGAGLVVEPTLADALTPFAVGRLGFLDFETVARAIPVWPDLAPWGAAAAQFSYHERLPDGTYRHAAHLAEGPRDARPLVAERLLTATRDAEAVVTYSSYEKTQIGALQQAVPDLANELEVLKNKLVDLLPVVRNNVYHPDFHGSFSIKAVLAPLVPGLSYSDLIIVNGLQASVEIARLLFVADRIPPDERDRVRQDLLNYCERDTWATVKLLESLQFLATS
jgi:predicted RecB family nuclease